MLARRFPRFTDSSFYKKNRTKHDEERVFRAAA
jgi:hypothetical protein